MRITLERLKTILHDVDDLSKAAAALEWDMQTYMPSGGAEARAWQISTLQRTAHEKFVAPETGELLHELQPKADTLDPDSDDARLVRVALREYEKQAKLPTELVAELARKAAIAHGVWAEARAEKNFPKFQPILEELVELTRRKAENLGYVDHIYDPLLDSYEPEMKTADVERIFRALKTPIISLIQGIVERRDAVRDTVFQQTFDTARQWEFGLDALRQMGFDFERGRQDTSAHPFTTNFSPDDVRITTRLNPDLFTSALFSSIHEGGHALYEQGVARSLMRTLICAGASMSVHESQSRFWENVIGRSRPFWAHFLPRLAAYYPAQLRGVSVEDVYRSINVVRPDYIRVEADEVTYNLHIFLRFELETALIAGDIEVKDLPELWNQKMEKYLGLTPPDDGLGVLQDVHWSAALFGYFPTYALGNALSLQFYDCLKRDVPECDAQVARGEFAPILAWLREHIYVHGAKFTPAELVRRVTGAEIDPQPYIRYLQAKYGELYGL